MRSLFVLVRVLVIVIEFFAIAALFSLISVFSIMITRTSTSTMLDRAMKKQLGD
jgi:hypothetical protein